MKWLEERERKKQEIQRAFEDQMSVPDAPRSSAKEAQRHPQETLDAGDGSPIVTDQLKINVMTEETPEGGAEETKPVFPAQSSAPASSPLLTEILRSPTSAATPTSSKTTSIVPTKFPFSSSKAILSLQIKDSYYLLLIVLRFAERRREAGDITWITESGRPNYIDGW